MLARSLTLSAFANKVTVGFTSDIKNLVPLFAVFKPTVVVSVPRVFEKVYNTAEQNASNDGKGKIFATAVQTAVDWSQAQDGGRRGPVLRAKHALFDRLVYNKLRAALGGDCHAAVSGGAPLGSRLGHFYRGVGLTIHEGYGLTETSSAITVNQVGNVKIGTVGTLVPGNSMRIAEDGELLVRGGVVFSGYWRNEQATDDAFTDGWFRTGDLGVLDEDGFLKITGRKKEIIVTAGGKNVAPAVLEDRLRAHPLISQAMVVGDNKPFIGALITIDPEAFDGWKQRNQKGAGASVGDLATDPDLVAEVDAAIKDANQAVSHAESIRKFRILPVDFTEDTGELTPTMKVKRNVVAEKFASRHRGHLPEGLAARRRAGGDAVQPSSAPSRAARVSQRHWAVTHSRPAAPIAAARSRSVSNSVMASAISPTSRPSTTSPVLLCCTVSGAPPELPAMTGTPVAEASRNTMPKPSTSSPAPRVRQGIANTSASAWCVGSSAAGIPPVKVTSSATPHSRASARSESWYGPPPTMTRAAPSTRRRIDGRALMSMSWPLRGTSRDTHTTVGRSPSP